MRSSRSFLLDFFRARLALMVLLLTLFSPASLDKQAMNSGMELVELVVDLVADMLN